MNRSELEDVMMYQLSAFNRTDSDVTRDTRHDQILTDEGPGWATPKRIYKAFVRASLCWAGDNDPSWPRDWMTLSVAKLAENFLPEEGDLGTNGQDEGSQL